jgi:hypothetical protein
VRLFTHDNLEGGRDVPNATYRATELVVSCRPDDGELLGEGHTRFDRSLEVAQEIWLRIYEEVRQAVRTPCRAGGRQLDARSGAEADPDGLSHRTSRSPQSLYDFIGD